MLSAAEQTTLTDLKRPSVFPVAALLVLSAISGCALKDGNAWSKDKAVVMDSIQQSRSAQAEAQARLEAMEQRLVELEATVKKQEAENRALAATVKNLRTKQQPARITSTTAKDQKLVRKLEKIESSIRSAATKGAPVIQPSDKSIEKNSYTAAYLALKSGRYEEASVGFKLLLKEHPQGEYADQAWFWLGESYFAQHKNKEAISAYKKVASDFPDSAKHPAALLKLATVYQQTDRKGDAKAVLQRLIRQHAETNAAEQARDQLAAIEAEQKK